VTYVEGSKEEPFSRTCARWYAQDPAVQSVLSWVADYRAGAMGPVQELEAPLLEYLRHVSAEEERWQERQMKPKRAASVTE